VFPSPQAHTPSTCLSSLSLFKSLAVNTFAMLLCCYVHTGMVPLLMLGRWGTPMPHPSKMTVVFGAPIEVPHIEEPSDEVVSSDNASN
jgi:hypothetical protein